MDLKKTLKQSDFIFKKKYGQNFLQDENILNNIISSANINKETLVIEIGPGAGALTRKIAPLAGLVLAYEIDKSLEKTLLDILNENSNVKIIYDDFLKRDILKDIKKYNYKEIIVVANLPYYITTPIITKFINEKINIDRLIIMVQDEVANRFSAKEKSKDYNSLTVFLNYYFDVKKLFKVSRKVFYPVPKVDSAVLMLKRKNKMPLKNEEHFFKLVKDSFKQKRKTLKNNLKGYDIVKIDNILKMHKKSINKRAEEISIEEFIEISNNLN